MSVAGKEESSGIQVPQTFQDLNWSQGILTIDQSFHTEADRRCPPQLAACWYLNLSKKRQEAALKILSRWRTR